MIRVTVENRPHEGPFKLTPPKPADRVIKTVATRLHVANGALSAGDQLFEGEDTVLAGDYIFTPSSASGGSACQGSPWATSPQLVQHPRQLFKTR